MSFICICICTRLAGEQAELVERIYKLGWLLGRAVSSGPGCRLGPGVSISRIGRTDVTAVSEEAARATVEITTDG